MTSLVPTDREQSAVSQPPRSKRLKLLRILIPVGLLLVAIALGWRYWFARPADSGLHLSGRIEGYETDLGAKVGGRIAEVTVREGDRVTKGQVIARLDDAELRAQLAAAQASTQAAKEKVKQAQLQLQVVASQIQEAQQNRQQDQGDSQGRISQATATIASSQAQLAVTQAQVKQAESALRLARLDRDRFAQLAASGAIAQQRSDQAQTAWETARDTLRAQQAAVNAAARQVNAAQGSLTQANSSQMNPVIRTTQIARLQTQSAQAQAQLAAARADQIQAQANQAQIAARIADLQITSPIDGVVMTRTVEPGEVISTGTTVLTVLNLNQVYLRGYIPEQRLGEVRVGQPAQVFLDSDPDRPLSATVTAIDTEASFTPENIYFQADRVTQVFGLKLGIDNPAGFAKPGMPADGEIQLMPPSDTSPNVTSPDVAPSAGAQP